MEAFSRTVVLVEMAAMALPAELVVTAAPAELVSQAAQAADSAIPPVTEVMAATEAVVALQALVAMVEKPATAAR